MPIGVPAVYINHSHMVDQMADSEGMKEIVNQMTVWAAMAVKMVFRDTVKGSQAATVQTL